MSEKELSSAEIEERVKAEILDVVKPAVQQDGGDIDFVSFDPKDGVVWVALSGHCIGCPMSGVTLKMGVESHLMRTVPGVFGVELENPDEVYQS